MSCRNRIRKIIVSTSEYIKILCHSTIYRKVTLKYCSLACQLKRMQFNLVVHVSSKQKQTAKDLQLFQAFLGYLANHLFLHFPKIRNVHELKSYIVLAFEATLVESNQIISYSKFYNSDVYRESLN